MEKKRNSGRTRIAVAGAVALAVGAFASLGATGYAARLVGFAHTTPTAAQYPPSKVTICHHTHSQKNPFVTITVSAHALPAHMKHGDTIGPCSTQVPTAPAAPAVAAKMHKTKLHKAHKAKHSGKKTRAHAHVKPVKTVKAKSNHGRSETAHSAGNAQAAVHGQGKTKDKSHGSNGKGRDKSTIHGQGHTKTHGSGSGQGHGPVQGHGQGSGDTHGGHSGGGKGNGH